MKHMIVTVVGNDPVEGKVLTTLLDNGWTLVVATGYGSGDGTYSRDGGVQYILEGVD